MADLQGSESDSVSDLEPLFPSDADLETSSGTLGAIYPSDVSDEECQLSPLSPLPRGPTEDSGSTVYYESQTNSIYANSSESASGQVTCSDDERESVATILITRCCKRNCLLHLTAYNVMTARRRFFSFGTNAQRQWVIDRLHENSYGIEKGSITTKYFIAGDEVCQVARCAVYSISKKRITRMLKSASLGYITAEHGNKGKKRSKMKTQNVTAWMERYFHLVGDKMPHKDQIHLPSWETQKDVYSRYCADMAEQHISENELVSLSMFYKIWNDKFSNVVIPEQNRFAKCDICVKIQLDKKGCMDKNKQTELKSTFQEHLKRVEIERKKYHHHREKSRSSPEKYLTLIIDGMDQAKTNLPNTKLIAKSTSGLWRLRTHVTGVLLHTRAPYGKIAFSFIDILQWPHDSNLTMTLLMNVLIAYQKQQPLPETLYIQMDNTSRENKNKFVIGFCAIIVELQIFQKVQMNFLPVGHTHEDVDQLFSKIAEEIKHTGCECIPDLLQVINCSSTPNPISALLDAVWDFKKWMEPYLCNIEGHSKYLVFRFTLGKSGKAQLHYKRFSTMPWEPEGDGIHVLSGCPEVVDCPQLVPPCTDKLDLEHFFRDLEKYQPWLSASAREAWKEFSESAKDLCKVTPGLVRWELHTLVSAAIRAQAERQSPEGLSFETSQLLQKETAAPPKIVVRQKGKKTKEKSQNTSHKDDGLTKQVAIATTQGPSNDGPANVPSKDLLKYGMHVACFIPKYKDEEPQIGKIISFPNDQSTDIEVEWMVGTYTECWVVWRKRQGKGYITWKETVPVDAILFPITLNENGRLNKTLVQKLKNAYKKIRHM